MSSVQFQYSNHKSKYSVTVMVMDIYQLKPKSLDIKPKWTYDILI